MVSCCGVILGPYFARWMVLLCNLISFSVYVAFIQRAALVYYLSNSQTSVWYPWVNFVFGSVAVTFMTLLAQFILMIITCVLPEDEKTVPCFGKSRIPLAIAAVIVDVISAVLVGTMAIYLFIENPCPFYRSSTAGDGYVSFCGYYESSPSFMVISLIFLFLLIFLDIASLNANLSRKIKNYV